MASESTTQRDSTTPRTRSANGGDTTSGDAVQTAIHEVRGAIRGVGRAIETGSDARVTAGVSLSLGLALGMLLGGAPRLLVLLALAPVVASGLVLADGRTKAGRAAAG